MHLKHVEKWGCLGSQPPTHKQENAAFVLTRMSSRLSCPVAQTIRRTSHIEPQITLAAKMCLHRKCRPADRRQTKEYGAMERNLLGCIVARHYSLFLLGPNVKDADLAMEIDAGHR